VPVPVPPDVEAAKAKLSLLAAQAATTIDANCSGTCKLPWVRGTLIHTEFERLVRALGPASGFEAEVSYLDGVVVDRGTKGSSRADAIYGPRVQPKAAYDLKTGFWGMTNGQAKKYQDNLPEGTPIGIIKP
jgi:hypothetical protein